MRGERIRNELFAMMGFAGSHQLPARMGARKHRGPYELSLNFGLALDRSEALSITPGCPPRLQRAGVILFAERWV